MQSKKLKVGYLSDIHFNLYSDVNENKKWQRNIIDSLEKEKHSLFDLDVLVIAGDVSESVDGIIEFFKKLPIFYKYNRTETKNKYVDIIFVPGNHDLWEMNSDKYKTVDDKVNDIKNAVEKLGPHYHVLYRDTLTIENTTFGGIFGWYHLPHHIVEKVKSDNVSESIKYYQIMEDFKGSSNDSRYIFKSYSKFIEDGDMVISCQDEYEKDCDFLKKQSNNIDILISHIPLTSTNNNNDNLYGADFLYQFSPSAFDICNIRYNICGHTHIGGVSTFSAMTDDIIVLNNPLMSTHYAIAGKVNILTI